MRLVTEGAGGALAAVANDSAYDGMTRAAAAALWMEVRCVGVCVGGIMCRGPTKKVPSSSGGLLCACFDLAPQHCNKARVYHHGIVSGISSGGSPRGNPRPASLPVTTLVHVLETRR